MNRALLLASVFALSQACNKKDEGSSASASATQTASAATSAGADQSVGEFALAIEASSPIVLSRVEGGIVVLDAPGTHAAIAKDDGDLESSKAPEELPSDLAKVNYVGGRLPKLWLSVERKKDESDKKKKEGKSPFYRYSNGALKEIADDWEPLVVPWTKNRILTVSTSSGKLKIKLLDPFTKDTPKDQPARFVPDDECRKSIKLAEAVTLPTGDLVAAGRCAMGADKKNSYVLVSWKAESPADATTPQPVTSAAPSASASASAPPSDSAAPESPPPTEKETAEANEKQGVPMTLRVVSTGSIKHRALAFAADGTLYLAATGQSAKEARIYRVRGEQQEEVTLPAIEGNLRDFTVTKSGELWLVSDDGVWRRPASGEWSKTTLPSEVSIERVEAAGDAVWLSGMKGQKGILLRKGAAKTLSW